MELLFRELKTLYALDEFDTSNPAVVEILLYAAVLTLLVSRELLKLVIDHADEDAVFPPERWAATLRSHAQQILKRLSDYLGYSPPPLRIAYSSPTTTKYWSRAEHLSATRSAAS